MTIIRVFLGFRQWTNFFRLSLAFCLIAATSGCGDSKQPVSPAKIQAILDDVQQTRGIPGMAAAVITSAGVASARVGVRKLGEPAAILPGDLFHLGSCMKSMTAMLAAKLVETGKLRWDTTLPEVFPELAATMLPEYKTVTMEYLLSHRGGIIPLLFQEDIFLLPPFTGTETEQRQQFVAWALQQPPIGVPGLDFNYSNGGYAIAGAIIERVSGTAYEDMFQQVLVGPLGLKPKFDWPGKDQPNQPWGHVGADRNSLVPNDPNAPENQFPKFLNPAGNISLSVEDFARYAQAHLRGLQGRAKVLTAGSYQKLHSPSALNTSLGVPYCFGWVLTSDIVGNPLTWHDGSAGTFFAIMFVNPKKNKAVVVVSNAGDDDGDNVAGVQDAAQRLLELLP
jgi:CubicO group peptidase (beta-lactamase class C family)